MEKRRKIKPPCIDCNENEPLHHRRICSPCFIKRRDGRTKHQPSRQPEYRRAWRKQVKLRVIERYGGKCECCSEANPDFLTMDHVRNNGAADRELHKVRRNIWESLHAWEVDKSQFRLLCYQCNIARHQQPDKICPHQKMS